MVNGDNSNKTWNVQEGTTTLPEGMKVKYRNWNRDYFTSATPTPQGGTAVQIPMVGDNLIGDAGDIIKGPWQALRVSDDLAGTGDLTHAAHIYESGVQGLEVGGNDSYYDIQGTAATIATLRLATKTQEWLERLNRTGSRYRDVMRGFFGTDPLAGVVEYAIFIGSMSSVVQITDVMSMAETTVDGGTTVVPIGAYAGKAMGRVGGKNQTFHCKEHGVLIGIINLQPRSGYYQGIHKMWTRADRYDYAWPEFAAIGDQEIKVREFAFNWNAGDTDLIDDADNTATWAYIPRYSEYRYMNDIVSGIFRITSDGLGWHLNRVVDSNSVPALNDVFLTTLDIRETDIMNTVSGADTIFAHIWNKVSVQRALPKYGVPSLV